MEIIYLGIAVVFAALCYVVAGQRGRNQILWGVLGLVFGFIPLIILFIMKDLSKETRSTSTAGPGPASAAAPSVSGERKPCPQCGESIAVGATVCRFCQAQLSPITQTPGGAP